MDSINYDYFERLRRNDDWLFIQLTDQEVYSVAKAVVGAAIEATFEAFKEAFDVN